LFCACCKAEKDDKDFYVGAFLCKKCHNASAKRWQKRNAAHLRDYRYNYYRKHAAEINKKSSEYTKNRCENDEVFKMRSHLSALIRRAATHPYTHRSESFSYIGTNYQAFWNWLGEPPGHRSIEFICPLSQAQNLSELRTLCNYTNIRWRDKMSDRRFGTDEQRLQCMLMLNRQWVERKYRAKT
jgi:hypothetical protein